MLKAGDISRKEIREQFGIGKTTLENWINEENPLVRENQRLKRQNKELLALIGKLTLETTRVKKNLLSEELSSESEESERAMEDS